MSDPAHEPRDDKGQANEDAERWEPNIAGVLLGMLNLVWITEHPDVLIAKVLPELPLGGFDAACKAAGWFALAAILFSRPAGFRHWLGLLAGVLLIDLAGFALAVTSALVFGAMGLDFLLAEDMEQPLRAIGAMLGFVVLVPFIGGLGKAGLLPGFFWPADDSKTNQRCANGWVPPFFANLMALVTVLSLVFGLGSVFYFWIAETAPDSPLMLMHQDLWVLPVIPAAIITVGTGLFAPNGSRPWPTTGLVAMSGAAGMVALMVALALTSPLWAWPGASDAALSTIVTGLPALALIPLGIAAWRVQKREPGEAEGGAA